ncbi:hypothetical protein HBH98_067160 [Parastagonospora nodorum]|nr:hypothetical protein HBH53_054320 [Parastagonospora nodorum]KAH4125336.1 hypothetical protein HBH47_064440 [Parastagonospora nodorum]KAH4139081.1 hypothetical protein HBH45_100950 [Parastagonospora nodorum]KAH4166640.1 hypothetical protein HBH44_062110 [Parastagonospora nodorum]KAH4173906.1 hypothetical protein HBH43_084560 [Parastagonospora nodorum]
MNIGPASGNPHLVVLNTCHSDMKCPKAHMILNIVRRIHPYDRSQELRGAFEDWGRGSAATYEKEPFGQEARRGGEEEGHGWMPV